MTLRPGELWLAEIPFTSGHASKTRPVLVLWIDASDTVVAAVTSAPPLASTDVALGDWNAAGLRVASTVRLSRLDCLEQRLLRQRLGTLSLNDAQKIRQVWTAKVGL
jgi:mRNA interferase MazF